jgi:hypothetical protein
MQRFEVSERKACRVLGQARSTQRCVRKIPDEEEKVDRLVKQIVEDALKFVPEIQK